MTCGFSEFLIISLYHDWANGFSPRPGGRNLLCHRGAWIDVSQHPTSCRHFDNCLSCHVLRHQHWLWKPFAHMFLALFLNWRPRILIYLGLCGYSMLTAGRNLRARLRWTNSLTTTILRTGATWRRLVAEWPGCHSCSFQLRQAWLQGVWHCCWPWPRQFSLSNTVVWTQNGD